MAIILLSSSGFISIEASAQTNERKVYSCAFDGYVNMREDPSYSAKKVGKFNNGPEGAVLLELLGDWAKIDVSGTVGYVPTKYIQETPTIAYTGDVSVDWIEGIWKSESIASSLLIYNNGTWERGYDFKQAHGKYILQNNEIKFMTIWCAPEMEFNEILPINQEENRLGDYERGSYMTQEEKEENRDDDGEYFPLDYGTLTKEDFKAWGKQLLEEIESETSQHQEFQNSLVESVVSLDTTPNEDVQDTASGDVVEEIENANTPFFESEAFIWLKRALIAVLAFLFVLWLAKLIKKTNQKSKEKRLAKTQKEAEIAQNTITDISKDAGRVQPRKRFPWAAILIPVILVVAVLAAIKMFGDNQDAYDKQDAFGLEGVKVGFINQAGELVVPCIYDRAERFDNGMARVSKDGKYGIVNILGELVVPCIYDDDNSIWMGGADFRDNLSRVYKDGKYGFIDKSGEFVVPCIYDDALIFSEGMAAVKERGKWGFINTLGEVVIPCSYDGARYFHEGMVIVQIGDKFGYINKSGEFVVPCIYDYDSSYILGWDDFHENFARVLKDGKYGFVNKSGELVVPCIYDDAFFFNEGMASVKKDGQYGFVNDIGELVIPCIYDSAFSYSEGVAKVSKDGKFGFVNKSGELIVPCTYNSADSFSEGMARVSRDSKTGFVNTLGELVVPCIYDDVPSYEDDPVFTEGMARVLKDGKYGFINKSGELVVPCIYDSVFDFSEGMARVLKDGKCGFVNKSGELIVPCIHEAVLDFSEGMACVAKDGKIGFINKTGKVVIPCKYDYVDDIDGVYVFSEGMAMVEKDYGIKPKYANEQPKEKQEVEIPSFQTPQDVIFYLSRHTFKSEDKTVSVVVKHDGVYSNGYVLTTAPRVVGFSSDEASLMAHSPLNNADMHIDLVRQGDNYLLKVSSASYTIVENYFMAY